MMVIWLGEPWHTSSDSASERTPITKIDCQLLYLSMCVATGTADTIVGNDATSLQTIDVMSLMSPHFSPSSWNGLDMDSPNDWRTAPATWAGPAAIAMHHMPLDRRWTWDEQAANR